MARVVIPNYPHHVTQRGNYRQVIFEDKKDYKQCYQLSISAFSLDINR